MKRLILKNIFNPLDNCGAVIYILCRKLDIPVTKEYIKTQLEEHPDYPSLLSVSDVLKGLGVDNLALKADIGKLESFTAPYIIQLKNKEGYHFSVFTGINKDGQYIFCETISGIEKQFSQKNFEKLFTGIVLLVEAKQGAGEKKYKEALKVENRSLILQLAPLWSIFLITLVTAISSVVKNGISSIWPTIYMLLALIGAVVNALLLCYDIDHYNPILKELCSGNKKVNCNAILSSTASKIFGISWSTIGFAYFMGMLFTCIFSGVENKQTLYILAIVNTAALPYILFSVYYQYKVAKQWCVLCLAVQGILVLQFAILIRSRFFILSGSQIGLQDFIMVFLCFIVPFLIAQLLIPAMKKAKEGNGYKLELNRLKHNTEIFESLLTRQPQIDSVDGLGITIGNRLGKYQIVKVCNPYCGPCSKAHSILDELLEINPEVGIRIIFTASSDYNDIKFPPTKLLLAIAEKGMEQVTKQALDQWYLSDKKDYNSFAASYPMKEELIKQTDHINHMREWCDQMRIQYTPTFFVSFPSLEAQNNKTFYQLPEQYTVSDLKYFLSV